MFKYLNNIYPVTYFKIYKKKLITLGKEGDNFRIYHVGSYEKKYEIQGDFGGGIYSINNYVLDDDLNGFDLTDFKEVK